MRYERGSPSRSALSSSGGSRADRDVSSREAISFSARSFALSDKMDGSVVPPCDVTHFIAGPSCAGNGQHRSARASIHHCSRVRFETATRPDCHGRSDVSVCLEAKRAEYGSWRLLCAIGRVRVDSEQLNDQETTCGFSLIAYLFTHHHSITAYALSEGIQS